MMIALVLALTMAQGSSCADAMLVASQRAGQFDLQAAISRLTEASAGCADADIARWYLQGWLAAREAYRYGGSPESLVPADRAIDALKLRGDGSNAAAISEAVLRAAAAAAQSEREVMALFLDQALLLEVRQRAAGLPGAPIITAHEAAGDLWLQVHRFEEARQAYERAAEQVGRTSRVVLGLARSSARLDDAAAACAQYRSLIGDWPASAGSPPEVAEARAFLGQPSCSPGASGPALK